jgi:hypothetical protein
METCYNCGIELVKGQNKTKEHVPPQNLFAGYEAKDKENRITVPACFDCNNKYSDCDEEFRNLVGIITKNEENSGVTSKTGRGLSRNFEKVKGKIKFIAPGEMTLEVDRDKIIEFHKKNFKALYYKQFGHCLPADYEIMVNIDENDSSKGTEAFIAYLDSNFKWKVSGSEKILKYIIQPIRTDWNNSDKSIDLDLNENEPVIGGLMVYNQTHGALVVAAKKDRLNKKK